jgi:hypothetical protein
MTRGRRGQPSAAAAGQGAAAGLTAQKNKAAGGI